MNVPSNGPPALAAKHIPCQAPRASQGHLWWVGVKTPKDAGDSSSQSNPATLGLTRLVPATNFSPTRKSERLGTQRVALVYSNRVGRSFRAPKNKVRLIPSLRVKQYRLGARLCFRLMVKKTGDCVRPVNKTGSLRKAGSRINPYGRPGNPEIALPSYITFPHSLMATSNPLVSIEESKSVSNQAHEAVCAVCYDSKGQNNVDATWATARCQSGSGE